ncbi:MAG: class I SAM-dependent methyltransferase [Chromatiales bacterium]|nr:MAG: class I SAM-dependent methyltransferase [Chromatiales bacterium]
MAEQADRHALYEQSVQNVESEVEFIRDTFKELRGRVPVSFREDFCGTAAAACEWIRQGPEQSAIGVDIDEDVLDWGRRHNVAAMEPEQQARLKLHQDNVLEVVTEPVDVVGAFNFSYYLFKTRDEMRAYFRAACRGLKPDGILFLDAFGGHEAFEEMKEKTKYDNFTYIWDQASYHPISGDMLCHIHFKFPDGSRMKKAFTYDWRLWTLPEIREVLAEAGFRRITVYWEGTDEDGEGDGEFTPDEQGEADAGWIVYITAER